MGDFRRKCREARCHIRSTEPYSPWSNAAEGEIRELKKEVGRDMVRSHSPKRLWDDCIERRALIRSHTALNRFELQGEVPETVKSGTTADISALCELGWYEWIKFRDTEPSFPEDKEVLGRYLGPALDVGPAMTAKILKANGERVYRSTYRPLTEDEVHKPEDIKEREEFDAKIAIKLGPSMRESDLPEDAETPHFPIYQDDAGGSPTPAPDAEDVTPDTASDNYLGAEVLLPHGGQMITGKVKCRKRSIDGNLKGTANRQPILDTRTYEVEFPDGEVAEYAANVIAENMFAQCDLDGRQHLLMDAIVDHKTDGHAVAMADKYITVKGRKHVRQTTKGWHLCVRWKDGTTTWERLADLKESNPVEVAEYAVSQGVDHEPAFAWWVPHTLHKRNRIIAAVNKRYHKRTHKFGIRIPKSVAEAKAIDKENGNTLWMDALDKEMSNVRVAFKTLQDGETVPPGYQQITGHIVWDVKMEDFRRKARYVADGHKTEAPATLTYCGVVSRESVRIALTLAALNDLEVKTSDIQNAFLTAPCAEKCWTVLGPEFGSEAGQKALIVRALYGLKSAGASFRQHLADCMRLCGYKSCLADPDLWYKPMVRPEDGHKYYAYMLLYIDDALSIHHDATGELETLDKYFQMKPGSIGDPDIYLGAKLRKVQLENGVWAWGMSPSKYIQEAVRNVEQHLKERNLPGLKKKAATPLPAGYIPELDLCEELNADDANYFQSQIGVLRWTVELGRVDMITEVSALASHLALYHTFAYLKNKHNSRMVFDPTYYAIDLGKFKECDWKQFYGDVREPIPPNAPEPRGKEVELRAYIDSSHADDKLTRRSQSGHFIFMNSALIASMSKKQATIETSVFGAEFVAMKHVMETLRGLRYKLRMMGVPIAGPSYILGDNMSVIHNTQRPESTLKKKSNSICYHACQESVAMGESLTGHCPTDDNVADLTTKILPGGQKRNKFVGLLLHDIVDFE